MGALCITWEPLGALCISWESLGVLCIPWEPLGALCIIWEHMGAPCITWGLWEPFVEPLGALCNTWESLSPLYHMGVFGSPLYHIGNFGGHLYPWEPLGALSSASCNVSLMQASSRHPPSLPPMQANEPKPGFGFEFVFLFVFCLYLYLYVYVYLYLSSPLLSPQCGLMSPIQVLPRAPALLNLNPTCHKYKTPVILNQMETRHVRPA